MADLSDYPLLGSKGTLKCHIWMIEYEPMFVASLLDVIYRSGYDKLPVKAQLWDFMRFGDL